MDMDHVQSLMHARQNMEPIRAIESDYHHASRRILIEFSMDEDTATYCRFIETNLQGSDELLHANYSATLHGHSRAA